MNAFSSVYTKDFKSFRKNEISISSAHVEALKLNPLIIEVLSCRIFQF